MKSRIALAILAFALLFVAACSAPDDAVTTGAEANGSASSDEPTDVLTIADVEEASGLRGLELGVPEPDPATGASADVTVLDGTGATVLTVWLGDAEDWDSWLTDGYSVSEAVVPPVGDESFIGPNPDISPLVSLFAFRKGDAALLLETAPDANGELLLSAEELRALAELAGARL